MYMEQISEGAYSSKRLVPLSRTYRLSWWSWWSPEEAPSALAPIHTLTFAGTSLPAILGLNGGPPLASPRSLDAGGAATCGRPCASTAAGDAVR